MKAKTKLTQKVIYGAAGLLLLQGYTANVDAAVSSDQAAQANQVIFGSAEPGRINQSLSKAKQTIATSKGQTSVQEPSAGHLSSEAAKVTFKLVQIRVDGEQVFSAQALTAPYQSYLGKVVSLGDIETIVQEMTTRYQKAGYVLTRVIIPPQRIKDGVITLRVIEGYVDKVYVQGNVRPCVAALLEKYGNQIKAVHPLQIKRLERYALLANDLPGVTARVVLAPSKTAVGAADLTFVAQQDTASAYASLDNRGTKFLGPQQVTVGAQMNSVFRPGDTTSVQYLTTANKELNFVQVSHSEPLGTNGLALNVNSGYTRAEPGSSLQDLEIVGKSKTANAELSYPIIRARDQNLYAHGGVGVLDSYTTILGTDLYNDHIRFSDAGLAYSRADKWLGLNNVALDMTQGLNVFGASGNVNISRPEARPQFTKYNLQASRLQGLPANFSVLLAGQGQYTDNSLYAAEQFGFGGSNFGRGYDPSEITGDRGAAGKLELRYDIRQTQLYSFYDIGAVWNLDALTQPAKQSAASTGIGARFHFTNWLAGNLEVDKPLTKNVTAEDNRNLRVYFGITIADSKPYKAVDSQNNKKDTFASEFDPVPATPVIPRGKQ